MTNNNKATPGAYRPGAAAVNQKNARVHAQQTMSRKWQMCWKCQKEKSLKGGEITMLMGMVPGTPRKFICAECVAARKEKSKT